MFVPTPEQMQDVYLFTALMFVRVPSWRKHLDKIAVGVYRKLELGIANDKERFYQICAESEKTVGKPMSTDYETFRQHILNDKRELVQTSNAFTLHAMFITARSTACELSSYGYELYYAPKGEYFVTSDSPVFTLQPDGPHHSVMGMGLGHSRVQVYLPLNKRACLKLRRPLPYSATVIPTGHVAEINRMTMANAATCLYSAERSRRLARMFDQWGCKVVPGKNAFMPTPEQPNK